MRRAAKVVLVPGDVVVGEEFGNDVVVEVVDVDPVASVVDALDNVKKSSSNRPQGFASSGIPSSAAGGRAAPSRPSGQARRLSKSFKYEGWEKIIGISKVEPKLFQFEEPLSKTRITFRSEMRTQWLVAQRMECRVMR